RIEDYLHLCPGDKVTDANTGRVFTLICKTTSIDPIEQSSCECLWYAECQIRRGTQYLTGCILYTGIYRPSDGLPLTTEVPVGTYILKPFEPFLYQLVQTGNFPTWVAISDTPNEYYFANVGVGNSIGIFYVRRQGSLNTACNTYDQTTGAAGAQDGVIGV